jgi:catechol 2,3-dioxygenase-like lactoylglutathione lyase family enzyme
MRGVAGRLHHLVIDCPDPRALAGFYSALLSWPVTYDSVDFVVVAKNDTSSGLAFQRAPDQRPSSWPEPTVPQQMHLDIMVDDLEQSGELLLELGATCLDARTHVFADLAGHPFCLIPRPGWAPPVG